MKNYENAHKREKNAFVCPKAPEITRQHLALERNFDFAAVAV